MEAKIDGIIVKPYEKQCFCLEQCIGLEAVRGWLIARPKHSFVGAYKRMRNARMAGIN